MSWDGKVYDKYRIEHADGTPLKGKAYFVLRLDSDDPVEAARVAAAMRAYKGEPRNYDIGTADEQGRRFRVFCKLRHGKVGCEGCPFWARGRIGNNCELKWAQLPYREGGDDGNTRMSK